MNNMQRAERTDFEIIEPSTTSDQIKVRACSIVNKDHPEWGTFGVMADCGDWFDIHGRSGWIALFKSEADKYWSVVKH